MGKTKGDRASRRRKNIIVAKAQRKLRRIKETMIREALAAEGKLNPNCHHGIMGRVEAQRIAVEMEGLKA